MTAMTPMTAAATMQTDLRQLQDSIAHRVAAAFEAGGITWRMTAPLLGGLVADELMHGPAVVTTRALGQALRRQAVTVERSLANGDRATADDIVARLRTAHRRLAETDNPQATVSRGAALDRARANGRASAIQEVCPHP